MASRLLAACAIVAAIVSLGLQPRLLAEDEQFSVRITSPLGRTGLPGTIRIVAQVYHRSGVPPGQVRFYVDDQLLGSLNQGPPYAVEWVDDNPFERREIAVEAVDVQGNAARDQIVLEPFEIIEAADIAAVLLDTSVQDRNGRFIKNLDVSTFSIMEDGELQTIDIARQEAIGATFALLIDRSESMSRRLDYVQQTAMTLAGYMGPKDQMIIAPFSKEIGAVTGPTNDRATIAESIQAITPSGGTAILDSLTNATQILAAAEGRRAIVLITDGYDEDSEGSFEQALAAVKSAGATLYVVGIGGVAGISIKGERLLRRLALDTGGRFFFPARDTQLAEVDHALTEDVQNRYLLSYTPLNQKLDGTWREITVTTGNADYVIRTRPGYFAPKPPPIRPAIEFTAIDPSGEYLNLAAEDLEIVENGVPQSVDAFQEAVEPVSIVLALDASGSMAKKEADVVASAREFISTLRPQDKLALVLFADRPQFAQDFSKNHQWFINALNDYKASGGTALYDALAESLARLKRVEGRRVVVVMTDGRDENNPGTAPGSVSTLEDVTEQAHEVGALIFGIGLGAKVDQKPLQTLSDLSGGRAFFPADVSELPGEYRRVVDDLRRRYVVGYTSSNIQRDGSWRDVTIQVKSRPEAVI
ncbi:MAG TPA: VWA domain-containing protein, partial [Vicinamibacterales bacterium]|nr:VWA domain-containing protein [Vicinamibacterales bacterium]